ncbi:VanZ family protein [Glutamicibacter soli]|uniref:VanZ family protein n=1 Tax=Glutamicibacter soli TaxID=453836 RepID=A0A365YCJ0_9MICC|nr:VanZ family protein [Glutamicibacter soli]RBM00425.1 VanZ family protein [Glutamicibacter soli]
MRLRNFLGVVGVKNRSARWALVAAVAYAIALVLVAFWPTPVDTEAGPWLFAFIEQLHRIGVPQWFGYGEIEFGANILYFMPLGLLASWWLRWPWLAVLCGLGVSVMIETGQLLLLPDRVPSARDLVANTLGTGLGALVFLLCRGWLRRRARQGAAR